MENFLYDEDYFCSDIEELLEYLNIDEEEINDLPDNWEIEVTLSNPEPVVQLNKDEVVEAIQERFNNIYGDERYPEDYDDNF